MRRFPASTSTIPEEDTAGLKADFRSSTPWLFTATAFVAVFFNVVFPKGGFKIQGIPVTWGYVVLTAAGVLAFFALLVSRPLALRWGRIAVLALVLPCQISVLAVLYYNGWRDNGAMAALVVNFLLLPPLFLGLFGYWFDRVPLQPVFGAIRWSVVAVSAYGIFLFFWKQKTGSFIEIPFLTVNAQDVGLLETKHIRRGDIFKLISTYNNGNVFGVCMLMMLPFYFLQERRIWVHAVILTAMALTLSRTVWAGFPMVVALHMIYVQRLTMRRLLLLGGGICSALVAVWVAAFVVLGRDLDFLLDTDLGGRSGQFAVLHNFQWWPSQPFDGIAEVFYMSWLRNFGAVGFVFMLAAVSAPLVVHFWQETTHGASAWQRAGAAGAITYLFAAWSDGLFESIPSYAFFWFCCSVAISPMGGSRNIPSTAAV